MAGLDIQGIAYPGDLRAEVYNDIVDYIQQFEVNRYPIMARSQRQRVTTPTFQGRHFAYTRPRKYGVMSAMNATDTYTVLSLPDQPVTLGIEAGDSTCLMDGDILTVDSTGEVLEVIAVPVRDPAAQPQLPAGQTLPAAQTVLVKRGASGSTPAAVPAPTGTNASGAPNTTSCTLVGNSRTGGEVWTTGIRARPILTTLQCQNWQYKVEVSMTAQTTEYQGFTNLYEKQKKDQFVNQMDDMEYSSIYGRGEPIGTGPTQNGGNGYPIGNRPKQVGMIYQCFNQVTATSGTTYTPALFEQDVSERLYRLKSSPNLMLCGYSWSRGFALWNLPALRVEIGNTRAGVAIESYETSLVKNMEIVYCSSMNPYDAIIGRSELIYWRAKRDEAYHDYGYRGDRMEGEWSGEGAIELRDPEKFVYLNGVTAFSKP